MLHRSISSRSCRCPTTFLARTLGVTFQYISRILINHLIFDSLFFDFFQFYSIDCICLSSFYFESPWSIEDEERYETDVPEEADWRTRAQQFGAPVSLNKSQLKPWAKICDSMRYHTIFIDIPWKALQQWDFLAEGKVQNLVLRNVQLAFYIILQGPSRFPLGFMSKVGSIGQENCHLESAVSLAFFQIFAASVVFPHSGLPGKRKRKKKVFLVKSLPSQPSCLMCTVIKCNKRAKANESHEFTWQMKATRNRWKLMGHLPKPVATPGWRVQTPF